MLAWLLILCVLGYVPDTAGDLAAQESNPEPNPAGDLGDADLLSANLEAELRDLKNRFARLPKEEQRIRVQNLAASTGGYQDLVSLAGGYQDLGRLARGQLTVPPNWSSYPAPHNSYFDSYCPCATQPQMSRSSWPPAPETSSPLYMKKIKQPYPQNKRRKRRNAPSVPVAEKNTGTEANTGSDTDHQNLLETPADLTPPHPYTHYSLPQGTATTYPQQAATYPPQAAYYHQQTAYYPVAPQQMAYYPLPPMPREELNKFHRNWFYDMGDDWETSDILRAHNPYYQTQEMLREEMDHYAYPLHWGNINLGKYLRPDLVTPAQHAFGPGYDFNFGDLSHAFHLNPTIVD